MDHGDYFVINVTLCSTCCRTFAAKVVSDICYQTGDMVAAGMTVSTVVLISAHSYHISVSVYNKVKGLLLNVNIHVHTCIHMLCK